jgi:hypothetical protein
MTKEEIPEIAKRNLADLLNKSGSILYSSHETLKPGNVYLLGFNPGGAGGNQLSNNIENLLNNESNAYLDESWKNLNGTWEIGEAPLQKRICWLLDTIGFDPREVCASNLIFFQSREAKDINFNLAQRCWPIHEAIIKIVKPKLIISFGNSEISPYRFLHRMLGGTEVKPQPARQGNWKVKGFNTSINCQAIYVAGLPHLSRYSPIGKTNIVNLLRSKI